MIDLKKYGYPPHTNEPMENGRIPARVTSVHKERYEIMSPFGPGFARLKSSIYFNAAIKPPAYPTVGDFVCIQSVPEGDSVITSTLPRHSSFLRMDPSSAGLREQAVAANFDTVLILTSLHHDFSVSRLERYVTLAWQSGAVPVIVLTKKDLAADWPELLRQTLAAFPGIAVFAISALTGEGLDQLAPYLKPGSTMVLLGSSGVGKSSLLNALADTELMKTGSVRKGDCRGRHTTTHRQLFLLPTGAMIIDTPGIRTLGMWDVTQGLGEAFADVEQLLGQCKFRNCTHTTEPGCAIQTAIQSGALPARRWRNYLQLEREARFSERKSARHHKKSETAAHPKYSKKDRKNWSRND